MSRLFFIDENQIQNGIINFDKKTARHFVALRKNSDDIIFCSLQMDDKKFIICKALLRKNTLTNSFTGEIITMTEQEMRDTTKIHILQCIPKLDKLEVIVQKCGELGVFEINPLISHYTQNHKSYTEIKQLRTQNIAKEASVQSGRIDIIQIGPVKTLRAYLTVNKENLLKETSLNILLNEYEKEIRLLNFIHTLDKYNDIYILIGSEGGFDAEEIRLAEDTYNFHSITLGERILRTETASIVIASILQFQLGEI